VQENSDFLDSIAEDAGVVRRGSTTGSAVPSLSSFGRLSPGGEVSRGEFQPFNNVDGCKGTSGVAAEVRSSGRFVSRLIFIRTTRRECP
jgi:hypothetical protein